MNWKRTYLLIGAWLLSLVAYSSTSLSESYRFPLKLNPLQLSGTFGELRPNHFHSGIDLKTEGVIGKPIYAIEDGYVYRLKVSPYGYGRAIYLRHKDGKFSVYGHLSGFAEDFEEYVYMKQYVSKKFEQELYLDRKQFPVKKGDLIAWSGSSGSSTGPHLHFEVRDPDERITNPIKYYPNLIKDTKSPVVSRVGIEPLGIDSRVNGGFSKLVLDPKGSGGNYYLDQTIEVNGPVGIEYFAWDHMNAAPNRVGINYAKLWLDKELVFELAIDKFSFDEKRLINVHFDYEYYRKKGRRMQRCYVEDGNVFNAYKNLKNKGIIEITDDRSHDFRIELQDLSGNQTLITGKLKRARKPREIPDLPGSTDSKIISWVNRGVLAIKVDKPSAAHQDGLNLYLTDGSKVKLADPFYHNGDLYFLHQMDSTAMPAWLVDPGSGSRITFDFVQTLFPEKQNLVKLEHAQFYFQESGVFDTLQLEVGKTEGGRGQWSPVFKIGDPNIPLPGPFVISLKPTRPGAEQHLVVAEKRGRNWRHVGRDVDEEGWIYASSGTFGTFALMADSIPPRITPVDFSAGSTISGQKISFRITDNFAGIDSDKIFVTLDDSWVLAEYDAKSATVTCRWKRKPARGRHMLEIMINDAAGNQNIKKYPLNF